MPRDLDGLADVVVLTVKNALAPVLERLAISEQTCKEFQRQLQDLTSLKDRVVVMETKAAQPLVLPPPVDLTPVLERVAATEARLSVLGDLRDRVVTMETKAAVPVPAVLESVTAGPTPAEAELALRDRLEPLTKELAGVRERVVALETRPTVPGPAGQDGKDGAPGKDGVDGLGFNDLAVVQEDDRSFTVKAVKGDRVTPIGTARFPVWIHRGVYLEGKSYEQGDVVTWGGSQWHANGATTTKPGDGSKTWTLIVKRGSDGRDGRDAPSLPVLSVGRS